MYIYVASLLKQRFWIAAGGSRGRGEVSVSHTIFFFIYFKAYYILFIGLEGIYFFVSYPDFLKNCIP